MDWQKLMELAERFGDSFHLFDSDLLGQNYHGFLQSFRRVYPRTNFAYSYKTNYLPTVCNLVNEWGGYAEVVSSMEYDLARQVGVEPKNIIFNGPYKQKDRVISALLDGAVINLDSLYELEAVSDASTSEDPAELRVALRCNLPLPGESPSRFGFDVNGDSIQEAIHRLRRMGRCRIVGVHCHVLTKHRSPDDYRDIAEAMLEFAAKNLTREELDFVDLGGGFFSNMNDKLRATFPHPIPTHKDYAESIAGVFRARFGETSGPELILEPGISITADVMRFVARVADVKRIRSERYALVAGSVYDIKPTKAARRLPMQVVRSPEAAGIPLDGPTHIVGYTCMEDDVLLPGYEGPIDPGDFVIFDHVGAYTIVLKPPFIMPAPPILNVDRESNLRSVERRGEEMGDVFRTYRFD